MMKRMEMKTVDKLVEASAQDGQKNAAGATPVADAPAEEAESGASSDDAYITIDDFAKVELKVAKIVNAELVEGADKLLRLTLDVGDHERLVFSGIREAYDPAISRGASPWSWPT